MRVLFYVVYSVFLLAVFFTLIYQCGEAFEVGEYSKANTFLILGLFILDLLDKNNESLKP